MNLKSLRAVALMMFLCAVLPAAADAQSSGDPTGGASYAPAPTEPAHIVVPGKRARLLPDGTAAAPAEAPVEVQNVVFAANDLREKPYRYGGGHGRWKDKGYDCSGTVSYALHGGGLLKSPLDSGSFMHWGRRGRGKWITVFTNPGHAYAMIAHLRLDTSSYGVARSTRRHHKVVSKSAYESGPRWRPTKRPRRGFKARHPAGY